MRLGRRQAAASAAPAASPASTTPAGSPGEAGPVATYARILDGETLWLAVAHAAGPVGLRREGSSAVVHPDSDAPSAPGVLALRWDLPDALPEPTADAEVFEIVVDEAPLVGLPLPEQAPMRTPPTRDGRWQLDLRRREGGALVIRRERREVAAEVLGVAVRADGVTVRCTDGGLDGAHVVLVDAQDQALAELATETGSGGILTALVTPDDVPVESGPHWFLAVSDGERVVPLVRRHNDNLMPGQSTVLPLLWTDGAEGRSLVRLQFQREGRIRVNRPPTGDDGGET